MALSIRTSISSSWIQRQERLLQRIVLLFCVLTIPAIDCACTFPSALTTGTWSRSRDDTAMTFTSTTVLGLAVLYNGDDLGIFSCNTLSSNRYIIASPTYTTDFGDNIYYICWQFVQVSDNAFILYELSDNLVSAGYENRPGVTQGSSEALDISAACTKTTSTTLFTTLVNVDASVSDIAATCPSAVQASFTYAPCSASTLQSCTNSKYLSADYSECNTVIFGSAGGTVSCMGSAIYQGSRYVNLYKHDAGNDVICWRIPDTTTAGDIVTTYYNGDCTTTDGASVDVDLFLGEACPAETAGSGSGGGGSAAAIAGGAVGGILVAVLAVALIYFLFCRSNKVQQVASSEESKKKDAKTARSDQSYDIKIPEHTPSAPHGLPPLDTPSVPQGLPPLELNGKIASGEPLRG